MNKNYQTEMLISAKTEYNKYIKTSEIMSWIKEEREKVNVKIEKINFSDLTSWTANNDVISHNSGKFFSIEGISVESEFLNKSWVQPIINQPEIGLLGIIVRKIDGVFNFLLQAKIEPGNINNVQFSPTIQATRSNYTQVHKGRKPAYLEYFSGEKRVDVLVDQLQSEQGARFICKRNRNIIIKIEEEIVLLDNFCWLTLAQIKKLLKYNNIINMDTRTVLSLIPLHTNYENFTIRNFYATFYHWINDYKSNYSFKRSKIPLSQLEGWSYEKSSLSHDNKEFFNVIAVRVEINNREIVSWDQPLIEPVSEGIACFFMKKMNGKISLLTQLRLECGNLDVFEVGPTIQYTNGEKTQDDLFLSYLKSEKSMINILFDNLQSEEGGRFYQEQNRNLLIELKEDLPFTLPTNYKWLYLEEIESLMTINNIVNIEARSIISAINIEGY